MFNETFLNGKVIYLKEFFQPEKANYYFCWLKENSKWQQDEIFLFGKKRLAPRLSAWYGDEGMSYTYSGLELQPKKWNELLLEIKEKIENEVSIKFNSVLLNYYRYGQDSMGWHSDDEKELGKNPVIASLTFGYPRRFILRNKKDYTDKIDIPLEHNSLLIMKGDIQHKYQHSVPKTKKEVGERLNLTFRTIKH